MTIAQAPWYAALAPFVERDDLTVELAHPFLRPTGERVDSVPSVFLRLPQWTGAAFSDDLGKKTAAMVEVNGEHLFPELAVLRLLEGDGWEGRWIHTSSSGEITRYLTEWRDVSRQEQRSRPVQNDAARSTLYAIADRSGNRYNGCWSLFAWREREFLFVETKRQAPKERERLKSAQEAWVRAALSLREQLLSPQSFVLVQWEYRAA